MKDELKKVVRQQQFGSSPRSRHGKTALGTGTEAGFHKKSRLSLLHNCRKACWGLRRSATCELVRSNLPLSGSRTGHRGSGGP